MCETYIVTRATLTRVPGSKIMYQVSAKKWSHFHGRDGIKLWPQLMPGPNIPVVKIGKGNEKS